MKVIIPKENWELGLGGTLQERLENADLTEGNRHREIEPFINVLAYQKYWSNNPTFFDVFRTVNMVPTPDINKIRSYLSREIDSITIPLSDENIYAIEQTNKDLRSRHGAKIDPSKRT